MKFARPTCQILCALVIFTGCLRAEASGQSLPRSTPEAEGVSSEGLIQFVDALDQKIDAMHSVMVLRNGKVIAEGWWKPESAEKQHVMWSLSKSFTSTAVGLAIDEGHFTLDDRVVDFFPDDLPEEPSANLRAMRVRDLLTMTTGHEKEPRGRPDSNWVKRFLAEPVTYPPGTRFKYNTPATYMLSAIVQKTTGETVLDYLEPRFFKPLGIENPKWGTSPQGITLGGYGLEVRTEDVAKLGQLYLQQGRWGDEQLIPKSWVQLATTKQVSNGMNPDSDWNQGYGFQFWQCRHGAFRGDGKDGQFCIVLPELDAVVAITAKTGNMQGQLNVVWEHLLPAFSDEPLSGDEKQAEALRQRLRQLQLKTVD